MTTDSTDMMEQRVKPAWRDLLLLTLICLCAWSFTCGLWDLRGPDEGRYTQIGKELLQHRNWLHLTVMGEPYDQKPPLAFWLFTAMLALNDGVVSSGFVRQPSAIGATIVVLLVYLIGRKHWSRRAGLMAALMLATSAAFVDDAPTVELNMLYTFWITLGLYAWINRPSPDRLPAWRVLLFWTGVIGAFFVKGPLALLVILSALVWEAATTRQWRNLRLAYPLIGLPVTFALIGGWFYAEKSVFGKSFVAEQVSGETVGRMLRGAHPAPFWFYFPRLFTSICPPWAFFIFPAAVAAWRYRRQLERPLPALLGWLIPPFIILTLANGKRNSYLTPLIPALCLFFAWYIEKFLAAKPAPRWARWLVLFTGAAMAITLMGAAAGFTSGSPRFVALNLSITSVTIGIWLAAAATLIAIVILAIRKLHAWEHAIYFMSAILVVLTFVHYSSVNRATDCRFTTRPLSDKIHGLLAARNENEIGILGRVAEPEYHVYGKYKMRVLKSKTFDPAAKDLPDVLVVSERAAENRDAQIREAGYGEPETMYVSKDSVLIYQRTRHP